MEKQTDDISYSFVMCCCITLQSYSSCRQSLYEFRPVIRAYFAPNMIFFLLWLRSLKLKMNVCVKTNSFLWTAQFNNQCFICNCQFFVVCACVVLFYNDLKAKWVPLLGADRCVCLCSEHLSRQRCWRAGSHQEAPDRCRFERCTIWHPVLFRLDLAVGWVSVPLCLTPTQLKDF